MSGDEGKMSFLEHLEELRARLIRCALAVVGGTIACWFFREDILAFLEAPLFEAWSQVDGLPPPQPLNFAGMLDPFVAYLKLSAVAGVFVASPVILYNLWCFVSPGLYQRERKVALPFVLVSTLLFVGGSIAAYMIVFPIGFRFFLDFAAGSETDSVSVSAVAKVASPPESSETPALPEPPAPHRNGAGQPAAFRDAGTTPAPDAGAVAAPDAGPEPEQDAGTGTPDAGPPASATTAMADGPSLRAVEGEGAPDAGPATDSPPPEATSEGDPEQSWYDWILFRIVRSNCRELTATADGRGSMVLRFSWRVRECGQPPDLSWVKRDGVKLPDAGWSEPVAQGGEKIFRELVDRAPTAGAVSYEVGFAAPGSRTKLAPVLMVKDYLSFAIRLILAFGLIFELPVLISFLAIAGIVNYVQLLHFSRWFIMIAVVLAAILTPPDVVTQILLAVPLVVLYFVSVLVAYIFGPKPDEP